MKRLTIAAALMLFWLAGASGQVLSDDDYQVIAEQGIELLYDLQFDAAQTMFGKLITLRPEHPAGHFFLAMVDWWRIMTDIEDTRYDDRFLDSLDSVVDLCDRILDEDEKNATALFFKGGALGYMGRLKFHRDDWFAAANAGRRALPLVTTAAEADPDNYDIYLGTGIYNYYAEVIPERYPVAKPLLLFIPPGDKAAGIRQLHIAAEKGTYARVEAKYFLMQLYYMYENEYAKALAIALELHTRFPNNMLFHRYVGRCHITMSNFAFARTIFGEIVQHAREGKLGYNANVEREAEYYLGLCDMNSKSYESAVGHFRRCDELSRTVDREGDSGFLILANLNLGKAYDALSRRDLAVLQYRRVLDMDEYKDSYDQAEKYLQDPFPNSDPRIPQR